MRADAKSITFLGDEYEVQIPFFQRNYVWNKDNWSELLTDLLINKSTHFLGSLILKQQPVPSGEGKSVLVIDGQQRLTTLSILLKAIFDLFSDELRKNVTHDLIKYLFYKKHSTDKNYLIKINHSRVDAPFFKDVIGEVNDGLIQSLGEDKRNAITEKSNKILQCYKYFYDELGKENENTLTSLLNQLLNPENKILVLIDISETDNEQAIFDTINSAGVRLSGTDIVKNALFQRVIELTDQDEGIRLYEQYWDSVFTNNEESVNFWSTQKAMGRLKRDHSEILLQSIAVIKGIYNPDEHVLSELPDLYKDTISQASKEEITNLIKEIKDYAIIYKEHIPNFDKSIMLR